MVKINALFLSDASKTETSCKEITQHLNIWYINTYNLVAFQISYYVPKRYTVLLIFSFLLQYI